MTFEFVGQFWASLTEERSSPRVLSSYSFQKIGSLVEKTPVLFVPSLEERLQDKHIRCSASQNSPRAAESSHKAIAIQVPLVLLLMEQPCFNFPQKYHAVDFACDSFFPSLSFPHLSLLLRADINKTFHRNLFSCR